MSQPSNRVDKTSLFHLDPLPLGGIREDYMYLSLVDFPVWVLSTQHEIYYMLSLHSTGNFLSKKAGGENSLGFEFVGLGIKGGDNTTSGVSGSIFRLNIRLE